MRRAVVLTLAFVLLASAAAFASGGAETGKQSWVPPNFLPEWSESLALGRGLTSPDWKRFPETYSYDDMSKHYTVSLASFAWFPQAMPADDPVQKFYEDYLNVTMKGTWASGDDLTNKITTSFAANDPIDVFYTGDRNLTRKLLSEGLILADWTPYLKYMPMVNQYMTAEDKSIRTISGKMYGVILETGRGYQIWQAWMRKDWLDKLKLPLPKSYDDLFQDARAFTFNDPDGNGKQDTWALSSLGEGKSFGWAADDFLRCVFNIPDVEILNGRPTPAAISPKRREALAWFKRCIDAGTVDPNWYTQDYTKWMVPHGEFRLGMVGIWLPGAPMVWLYDSTPEKNKVPGHKVTDWINPTVEGYRQFSGINTSSWLVSAKAAKDEGKMKRIAHMLDYMTCPNDGYWLASRPMLVAGGRLEKTTAGVVQNRKAIDGNPAISMLWNWSAGIASDVNHTNWGLLEWYMSPPATPEEVKQTFDAIYALKKVPVMDEVSHLVTGDASIVADLNKFRDVNEYAFVTGTRPLSDWDKYVDEYLNKVGGAKLIADYTTQLKALGKL